MTESDTAHSRTEQRMSQPETTVNIGTVRLEIKDCVQRHANVTRSTVTMEVSQRCGCTEETVNEQVDVLKRHGFLYLAGDGPNAEVRLP